MSHSAHEVFLETGRAPDQVRTVVAASWQRSAAAGVDPEANVAPTVLSAGDLADYRAEHPLSQVFPLLYDVLGRTAEDCDCVMAVGDAAGRLLWVSGTPAVLRLAETINFVEGTRWDETSAGTNAPGTALALDAAVQIRSTEHFNRLVHPWSCAAAPIHDPATHEILGLVDVTGGEDVALPQTLGMIRAAARMAESELARIAALSRTAQPDGLWHPAVDEVRLQGLGRPDCLASFDGTTRRLSPRHSEIAVVLADLPDGLTSEQLAIEIYRGDVPTSTIRAEVTRLRALLGTDVLRSRPYRFTGATAGDWQLVAQQLAAGRVGEALRAYRGPLLPQSDAPGIVRRRDELQRGLRSALLASGEADLMVAWTRSRWGADDLPMWRRQTHVLPPSSPLRAMAAAEADRLERELRA